MSGEAIAANVSGEAIAANVSGEVVTAQPLCGSAISA
jgi:hypothetical protein